MKPEVIAAIIAAGISFIIAIANLIYSILAEKNRKKYDQEARQKEYTHYTEVLNKKNYLSYTTSSRQEWLLRLKQNVSLYLSLLTNDEPNSIQKISQYRYLIDVDLNIEGRQEDELRSLMFIAEYAIQSNLSSNRKNRIMHYINPNYKIVDQNTINCVKNNIHEFLNFLALKFEIFFKVEWERIKKEVSNPDCEYNKDDSFNVIESLPSIADKLRYYKKIFSCL